MDQNIYFLIFSGLLIGMVLGSFTTMLCYRVPRKMDIVFLPSHCPSCKTRLGVRDLVPIFSWLFCKGKCRHCGAQIGTRYIIIEIIVTALVTTAFCLFL
ncbi:MAG: prepilin peptidase [Bdellovibrionales bacterium]